MIVFAGQGFDFPPLGGFGDAAFGRSANGWIDSQLF